MKNVPLILRRLFLVACLGLPSCALRDNRGVMTYERIEVTGRPHFDEDRYNASSNHSMEMWIEDGKRPSYQKSWWNNDVLDRRHVNTSQRYKFEILEGKVVSTLGDKYTSSEVWRMYAGDRLVYDASVCRIHRRVMERASPQGTMSAEDLPRGFDAEKHRCFPNSAFEHDACGGLTVYTALEWVCPQCSDAEAKWLEKHPT